MRPLAAALLAAVLAIAPHLHSPAAPRFHWLPGFAATAVSDDRSDDAMARLAAVADADDHCSTFDAQMVRADDEVVLASMSTGVIVVDDRGHRRASAPLAECGGSADGVIALATGDAWLGAPVIAVVYSSGGRREAETTLALFRDDGGALAPLFAGALELRDGDALWSGTATLLPGALWYRPPQGAPMLVPLAPRRADASR
jgi:hypothetical protein